MSDDKVWIHWVESNPSLKIWFFLKLYPWLSIYMLQLYCHDDKISSLILRLCMYKSKIIKERCIVLCLITKINIIHQLEVRNI